MLVGEQKYRGFSIQIHQDDFAENPREIGEYIGTMVCFHNKYRLGDEGHEFSSPQKLLDFLNYGENYKDITNFLEDFPEVTEVKIDEDHIPFYLPLYLYDHSGITMSTGPFHCPWDSGQVGYIFISREDAAEAWDGFPDEELEVRAINCMKAEVEEYDHFLRGEIYGFVTEDENGDEIDSCWGFYGDPEKSGLLEEAKSSIDRYISMKQEKRRKKLKELINNNVSLYHREEILKNF